MHRRFQVWLEELSDPHGLEQSGDSDEVQVRVGQLEAPVLVLSTIPERASFRHSCQQLVAASHEVLQGALAAVQAIADVGESRA
eukprot:1098861-Pyramimonas_sp.AAC.1